MTASSHDAIDEYLSSSWVLNVLNAMADMVFVKGERSKLLWANEAFLDYYGMTAEQLRDIIDAPHSDPDDTCQYVRDDLEVFRSGKTMDIPAEAITNSAGEVAYFHTVKSPLRNTPGRIVGTVGVSRRNNHSVTVEVAADQREERKGALKHLRRFVANIPSAVAMMDAQRRPIAHSDEWARFFQHDVAMNWEAVGALPAISEAVTDVMIRGQRLNVADVVLSERVCDVHIQAWRLPNGDIGGTIIIVNDVTKDRIRQANLQRANAELSELNYRVAHDLIGPISSILGLLKVVKTRVKHVDDAVLLQSMEHLAECGTSLSGLIQDLRNYARTDCRSSPVEVISIEDIVTPVLDTLKDRLAAANIKIRLEFEVNTVRTERRRVAEVFEALLSNAARFYDPQKPQRFIRIASHKTTQQIVITVQDNGVGIDETLAPRVFRQFVRGAGDGSRSGLGLSVAHRHVAQLGGELLLVKRRNDTVFEFSVPIKS